MASYLEILTPNPDRKDPFISKYWGGVLFGSFAFAGVCVANWATRRPMLSGLQKHAAFTVAGVVGGQYLESYRAGYLAERDAVFRHYIELHPEDFPTPERKKYSEVLEPWAPIR